MSTRKIYQIYYSQETFEALDRGFIPLDNRNGNPKSREYWPIRQYFLNNPVAEDDLLGFFSPRFHEKTGLNAKDVQEHLEKNPGYDIYLFNPFFSASSWHLNVFEQGENEHPGITKATDKAFELMNIKIDTASLVMTSQNSVFCNYFIATGKFWKQWIMICEFISQISEIDPVNHGKHFAQHTQYSREPLPMKVFIIERIASLLLALTEQWKACPKLIFNDKACTDPYIFQKLVIMDSLKNSFIQTKNYMYLHAFHGERSFHHANLKMKYMNSENPVNDFSKS